MEKIKVVFRKDKKTKEVVAFLPELEVRWGNIMCYAHVGQHSEADYLYYKQETERAEFPEYESLFKELQSIYDNKLIYRQNVRYADVSKAWR